MDDQLDLLLAAVQKHTEQAPHEVNSETLARVLSMGHQDVIGALNALLSREMLAFRVTERHEWQLTEEGVQIATEGSHEAKVFAAVPSSGSIAQDILMKDLGQPAKIGVGKALKAGWVELKDGALSRKLATIVDETREQLTAVQKDATNPVGVDGNTLKELRKRKLVNPATIKVYVVSKGPQFALVVPRLATELTAEMVASGSWKTETFKKYNFEALGAHLDSGHLHPLLKVREEFRKIFFEMGFTEMPTNNFVESSFWNFDALFQPQQHPARDAHDTFFIRDPKAATSFPREYLERVRKVHSEGGYGSLGYRYDWKEEEAAKNILRTHTTAVSARMLYKLAQQATFQPVKYFSIDRVFRNEALDATHLAEFHQIEGVIADYDLSLGDLIGVLESFFQKLGIHRLRFKPAYNPYTEPSMEIFGFHPGLKRWIELGNSGVFRPEMLLPMGLPPNVSVIAWGVSLERPTMIKYGYNNIRDLCGHKINLEMVKTNPVCRLDK